VAGTSGLGNGGSVHISAERFRIDGDNSTGFTDPAGNPVPETQLVGSGEALVATGGHTVTATWNRAMPAVSVGSRDLSRPDGEPEPEKAET